jgi:3-methyladenine DNA glycosylase/8-oxoguanine DNA glycosylase
MGEPVSLHHVRRVALRPSTPFHFDGTLHKPSHFPSADKVWQPGRLWQTMLWEGRRLGLRFDNAGGADEPAIDLAVWSDEALDNDFIQRMVAELTFRYSLQADLSEFNRRFADDRQLGPIIARWRGMRPVNFNSLYEYLVIALLLQNCTVRRSIQMMQALFERYGVLLAYDGQRLWCFWDPVKLASAAEEELRALKLGYRARTLCRLTAGFAHGTIDEIALRARSREEQRAALLGLYGIGPASVGYILFDVFHHWDELEHISPWEQKIYSRLCFDRDVSDPLPVRDLIAHFVARFGRYRMLAVHYAWEDLFWRRAQAPVDWLEPLIRL